MLSPKTLLLALLTSSSIALAAPAPTTTSSTAPAGPTSFPPTIQTGLQTFQGYILTVISDYAQNAPQQQTTTDYSSTGRALDFYLRNNFLVAGPSACPQALAGEPLPPQATTADEGIAYLQQAQLRLIDVSQDALQGNFTKGARDFCEVIRTYGGAARSFNN
jgi:hypothetical protein